MNKTDRDASVPRNVQLYVEDTSNQLIPLKSDLSGQLSVDITVGDIIAIISGDITAKVSGETVSVASGTVIRRELLSGLGILISGQTVAIASGGIIDRGLLSGLQVINQSGIGVVINSGVGVTIQSGVVIASGAEIIWRGIQVSGAIIVSGSVIISGLVGVYSGLIGVTSGEVHIISGSIGAQISGAVQISGVVGISGAVQILSGQVSVSSGEVHVLSGQLIAKVSGEVVSVASGHVSRIIKGAVTLASSFSRGSGLATFDDVSVAPWVAGEVCVDVTSSYLVSGAYLNLYIEGKDNTTSKYKNLFSHSITSGVLSSSTVGTTWDTVTDMIFDTVRARHDISGAIGGTFTYQIAMQGRT